MTQNFLSDRPSPPPYPHCTMRKAWSPVAAMARAEDPGLLFPPLPASPWGCSKQIPHNIILIGDEETEVQSRPHLLKGLCSLNRGGLVHPLGVGFLAGVWEHQGFSMKPGLHNSMRDEAWLCNSRTAPADPEGPSLGSLTLSSLDPQCCLALSLSFLICKVADVALALGAEVGWSEGDISCEQIPDPPRLTQDPYPCRPLPLYPGWPWRVADPGLPGHHGRQ